MPKLRHIAFTQITLGLKRRNTYVPDTQSKKDLSEQNSRKHGSIIPGDSYRIPSTAHNLKHLINDNLTMRSRLGSKYVLPLKIIKTMK